MACNLTDNGDLQGTEEDKKQINYSFGSWGWDGSEGGGGEIDLNPIKTSSKRIAGSQSNCKHCNQSQNHGQIEESGEQISTMGGGCEGEEICSGMEEELGFIRTHQEDTTDDTDEDDGNNSCGDSERVTPKLHEPPTTYPGTHEQQKLKISIECRCFNPATY